MKKVKWPVKIGHLPSGKHNSPDDIAERVEAFRKLTSAVGAALSDETPLHEVDEEKANIERFFDTVPGDVWIFTEKTDTFDAKAKLAQMKAVQQVMDALYEDLGITAQATDEPIQLGYLAKSPLTVVPQVSRTTIFERYIKKHQNLG